MQTCLKIASIRKKAIDINIINSTNNNNKNKNDNIYNNNYKMPTTNSSEFINLDNFSFSQSEFDSEVIKNMSSIDILNHINHINKLKLSNKNKQPNNLNHNVVNIVNKIEDDNNRLLYFTIENLFQCLFCT